MRAPYWTDGLRTLYHGDSREIVAELEPGSVDMIFTDPPYGHRNKDGDLAHALLARAHGSQTVARPIANDGAEEADALARWLFAEAHRVLVPGGCACVCCGGGGGSDPQYARWGLWLDEALGLKHMVVWDKGGLGLGWHYHRNYEMVLVGQRAGGPCRWFGGSAVPNIVRIPRVRAMDEDAHPTPKPLALVGWFLRNHAQKGDLVLDPFAGEGTTLRAAKDRGLRAIGCELEERWCERAARRLEQEVLDLGPVAPEPQDAEPPQGLLEISAG